MIQCWYVDYDFPPSHPDLQNINLYRIGAVASTLHPLDGKGGDIDVRGSSRAKAINSDFQDMRRMQRGGRPFRLQQETQYACRNPTHFYIMLLVDGFQQCSLFNFENFCELI